jgi:hypothetical protein
LCIFGFPASLPFTRGVNFVEKSRFFVFNSKRQLPADHFMTVPPRPYFQIFSACFDDGD